MNTHDSLRMCTVYSVTRPISSDAGGCTRL